MDESRKYSLEIKNMNTETGWYDFICTKIKNKTKKLNCDSGQNSGRLQMIGKGYIGTLG